MTGSDTLQASTGECLFGIAAAKVTTEETFFSLRFSDLKSRAKLRHWDHVREALMYCRPPEKHNL